MSNAWNLTREQLAAKALQKVGNLARGETADPDDLKLATDALDGILKELPVYGYAWPQITSTAAVLAFTGAATLALPADFYDMPIASFFDAAGNEHDLPLVSLAEWSAIARKTDAGPYPQTGYVDPARVLHVWPVPPATVSGRLIYRRIIADSVTGAPSGLDASFTLGLVYAISAEIGDEFGATEAQMMRWRAEWANRRALGIALHAPTLPDRMSADD